LIIEKERIRLETDGGRLLARSAVPGSGGISLPRSSLVPLPFISYPVAFGKWRVDTGAYAASTGYRFVPDENLQGLLDGDTLNPETQYSLESQLAIDAGVSASISHEFELLTGRPAQGIFIVPRVKTYYRIAYVELDYLFVSETNRDGLPQYYDSKASLFWLYPSRGWGGGARFDLGAVLLSFPWRVGLSLLNLYRIDYLAGSSQRVEAFSSAPAEGLTRSLNYGSDPLFFVSTAIEQRIGRTMLVLGINGGFHGEYRLFGLLLRARRGDWIAEVKTAWQSQWSFTTTIAKKLWLGKVGVSCNLHNSPLSDRVSWGVGVSFQSRRRDR